MFDLIIRDRRIIDGRGEPTVDADLTVRDGRIAAIYGLRDRGVLTRGAWADMILFDPASVGIGDAYLDHTRPPGQVLTDFAA